MRHICVFMRVLRVNAQSKRKTLVIIKRTINHKILKLIKEQSVESVIDETIEWSQYNDPFLKFISIFMLSVCRGINYNVIEAKIKEVMIRIILHYFIHDAFLSLKYLIESI